MAAQDLEALKELWGDDSPNSFGRQVFDKIADEIIAQDARIATLEEQMANRMLCKKYEV